MRYADIERRLAALEAEAEQQAAIADAETQAAATTEAEWLAQCEQWARELAGVPAAALLNKSVTELLIWAELHTDAQTVLRMLEIIPDCPLEHLWSVGGREWYFDLCRLLQAPFQRKYWMDARLPRPPHVYWPGDPNYYHVPPTAEDIRAQRMGVTV